MTRTRTDITEALAGDFTRMLDYLSRVVNASDVRYLHQTAHQLREVLDRLVKRLADPNGPDDRQADGSMTFDPMQLAALVALEAKSYRAGRLLYPLGDDPNAAAAAHALTAAATALEYGLPVDGLSPAQASAVAAWLRSRGAEQTTSS